MKRFLIYAARIAYYDSEGREVEDSFPVVASTPQEATRLAFAYTLQVLKLLDFELRVVGA